eukprot:CAMPEP_0204197634 /NCGR_PEP_ID=MMETSP0361-20130328/64713_1 /ASSEMBLY_ACC=CAM_ASM_000343 /TAXON_ID=268821 /ORGANISM="Scrippsiella Hangoei, Strain SHTV-5" /LENGTH=52 /DNA_ID=CAMNT_0051159613 /DNA_START=134 /DNA_END=292 /DNA_ORIENTATION=-
MSGCCRQSETIVQLRRLYASAPRRASSEALTRTWAIAEAQARPMWAAVALPM